MAEDDVRDFLTALSAAGVRHLVVGAYALAHHGLVRATGDIDILVEPSSSNARKLERAVRDFAATSLEYFGYRGRGSVSSWGWSPTASTS
jgi:hypothetical protein